MKKILSIRGQQAEDIMGLLKCVATNDGAFELHDIHKATLEAMAGHLFHSEIDIDSLSGSFEGADKIVPDPDVQKQVMNMAGMFPFLEEDNKEERVDAFGRLATTFGLDNRYTKQLHQLCHNKVVSLAIDQLRPLTLEMGGSLLKGSLIMAAGFFHLDGDKKVLAQYQRYQEMDDGIFGKVMTDYYRDNHFALPGTPGAPFSNSIRIHDIHHVLAGYPTTPLGEICVFAFDGALMNADLGKALIGYVAQFQVGLQFDKGIPSWKHQFDPDLVLRAFERGGECSVDYLTVDFDFTELLEQPLAEVRERFNISPDGAIVAAPGDLWCGDLGVVGTRDSADMIKKKSWLEKLLSGKNVLQDSEAAPS